MGIAKWDVATQSGGTLESPVRIKLLDAGNSIQSTLGHTTGKRYMEFHSDTRNPIRVGLTGIAEPSGFTTDGQTNPHTGQYIYLVRVIADFDLGILTITGLASQFHLGPEDKVYNFDPLDASAIPKVTLHTSSDAIITIVQESENTIRTVGEGDLVNYLPWEADGVSRIQGFTTLEGEPITRDVTARRIDDGVLVADVRSTLEGRYKVDAVLNSLRTVLVTAFENTGNPAKINTDYSVGTRLLPHIFNDHYYEVTQAGNLGATLPPANVYPKDGGTLVIGTVEIVDMGIIYTPSTALIVPRRLSDIEIRDLDGYNPEQPDPADAIELGRPFPNETHKRLSALTREYKFFYIDITFLAGNGDQFNAIQFSTFSARAGDAAPSGNLSLYVAAPPSTEYPTNFTNASKIAEGAGYAKTITFGSPTGTGGPTNQLPNSGRYLVAIRADTNYTDIALEVSAFGNVAD